MFPKNASVVLVHGAWADGSSWARVIGPLKERGLEVSAASLPLTSLRDDVAALDRALSRAKGPVVLVGHAYAGAVIAEARSDKVEALVYVAALAPDEGEKVVDVFTRAEPHPRAPKLAPDENGFIWLPDEAFAAAFAQNAKAEDVAVLAAVQRPISPACITVPVSRPRWRDLPSWFLVAESDRMIAPATQHFMANRMHARVHAKAVDHTPSVTAPDAVVDIVLEATRATSERGR
jgi:pimeloyl-ACP methyl ester carboxylesterase